MFPKLKRKLENPQENYERIIGVDLYEYLVLKANKTAIKSEYTGILDKKYGNEIK